MSLVKRRSNGNIPVHFNGVTYEVPEGTRVSEILGQIYIKEHCVLGATLNNHLVSLETEVDGEATVVAVVPRSREGQAIVRRSACHLLHWACKREFPEVLFSVGQSLLGGYYYEIEGPGSRDLEEVARKLSEVMAEAVEADMPFRRSRVSVEAVGKHLDDPRGYKTLLLQAWAQPIVNLVSLDGYTDLQHGPYAPSTAGLEGCRVVPYPPGIILMFPESVVTSPLPAGDTSRLFQSYRETRNWNKLIGVATVGDLNSAALSDRIPEVVRIAEALHEKKIAEIADAIAARRDKVRLVCLAGPSSSGKTTFVRRLSVQLQVNGLKPVIMGMDDYYRNREDCPRDEDGDYDFEALQALDLELLDHHLCALVAGEEVALPRFDFTKGQRAPQETWPRVRLGPGEVLLMEGIHGLNPEVGKGVPEEARYRIFISALTQLMLDEHNRIFTSDKRLLRRLVRDRRYRGTSATETIMRWPSVRRGEDKNIFPFQEQADAIFNSTLVYESAVLKPFAWRYLLEVPRTHPARVRAYELLRFLELIVPVFPDSIPANSVLREFIGGSGFDY